MVINLNAAAEESPKGKTRKCLLDLETPGGHWLSGADGFGFCGTMEETMVGGGFNEPREGEAVRPGGPQSGEAEEVTEARLGSARWEPWKDKGPGSLGIIRKQLGVDARAWKYGWNGVSGKGGKSMLGSLEIKDLFRMGELEGWEGGLHLFFRGIALFGDGRPGVLSEHLPLWAWCILVCGTCYTTVC